MQHNETFQVTGQLVDIAGEKIFPATISIKHGKIKQIEPYENAPQEEALPYILPGFTDAHVHIESSMLIPSEFAKMAVVHGTVATVSDPHEIANVCGMRGIDFMIEDGKRVPFKFNFGAPSCVPATTFETAGATIDVHDVETLLQKPEIKYLSEMMNFPGVLFKDADVMQKLEAAKKVGKPIDGHAPGLRGAGAQQYIEAGISTDHECFTSEEALDKLERGMKILIREGSAAKNFDALIPLMHQWYAQMMFCSDDKHPDSLQEGHINQLCARAVAAGVDVFKVLQAACINPVKHYKLDVGLLTVGDDADFILVNNLTDFKVQQTYISGKLVAENGTTNIATVLNQAAHTINQFDCDRVTEAHFAKPHTGAAAIDVIEALDGQLITNRLAVSPKVVAGNVVQQVAEDILKIAVINRYFTAPVAIAFVKNIGLKKGALASSVAHDSHNIVVVGCDDASMAKAANLVIASQGGISATDGTLDKCLPLPVAGLMSAQDGYEVARLYTEIDEFSKHELGATLASPFMTLSFMALLVIPHLKLSDLGLFDGDKFALIES